MSRFSGVRVRAGRGGLGWHGVIERPAEGGSISHSTSGKTFWQLAKFLFRGLGLVYRGECARLLDADEHREPYE